MTMAIRPLDVAGRIPRLRSAFDEMGIDALVVTNLTNVRYLTGFTGSAGLLAVTRERAVLMTDGRYRTQSAEQVGAVGADALVEIAIGGGAEQISALDEAILPFERIGLEADDVTWSHATTIEKRLERSLVATTGAVERLREIKDAGEIDRMRVAASIADAALEEVLPIMKGTGSVPVTESEFALALDSAMRRRGAESVAFETIVAAGENSAKPHHHPTDRFISVGDPVVVDFGATYEGYRSDMTRTFVVGGRPEGKLKEIFDLVAKSQAAGVRAVRPGVTAAAVDEVCRTIITDGGMGERFEHSTGHGVGLDIHEVPWVSALGTATLATGTVVTVEPGVYVAGVGGVRIEDTLVVTDDGAEALTQFTKETAA
jgi:Xaa-Pro aminopeptidase